ncbi:MAG: dTDP-4-dehydrorhamnose reductase [Verrucomicrobia bacterium]|nr:dTDP-4-dehydrorhamnose reductase [Verrucomicrobiota bacterium]
MNAATGNRKVLITGAGGLLGGDLVRAWRGRALVGLRHSELDVIDPTACRRAIEAQGARVVVNCAARASLDFCETHRDEAFLTNADGPRRLAEACRGLGVHLVHISTDYVFDGTKPAPYTEDDTPAPLSVYSESKVAGERAVLEVSPEFLVVRVAWVFGFNDKSFVRAILRRAQRMETVGVIGDQLGSPTYSFDIAEAIGQLLEAGASGIVQFTNEGLCSRYDMTRHVFERLGLDVRRLTAISSKTLPWVAPRPAKIEVSKDKYRLLTGATVRTWEDALDDYLQADAECAALAAATRR